MNTPSPKALRASGRSRLLVATRFMVALVVGVATGCTSSRIGLDPVQPSVAYRTNTKTALDGPNLGIDTQTIVRVAGLGALCEEDRAECIAELHHRTVGEDFISDELFALAELSLRHADSLAPQYSRWRSRVSSTKAQRASRQRKDNTPIPIARQARAHYLAAALYAGAFLFPEEGEEVFPPLDPRTLFAADIFARGLAGAFASDSRGGMSISAGVYPLPFGEIEVDFDRSELEWGRRELTDFRFVGASSITGLNNRYRSAGLGTPVVAKTKLSKDDFDFVDPKAFVAGTVALRAPEVRRQLRGSKLHGTLVVYTANESPTIEVRGKDYPLAFDSSAALAASLERSRFWENELSRFLGRAIGVQRPIDLTSMEPYVRGKIPAVFVHGTYASPATWANMVNDLLRDPRIRDNFHFWFFEYDSGNSILYSEMRLRRSLVEAVSRFREAGGGSCLDQMIVIGHSQGGLLTKLTAVEAGDTIWDTYFKKPIDEVPMKPKMRSLLGEMAFLEPLPFVKRLMFIATPHRGSYLAGPQLVRRLASRLIQLPKDVVALGADRTQLSDFLRPETRIGRSTTSIDNMSPRDSFIKVSSKLPIAEDVPVHSIVALRPGNTEEEGSDGVVKFTSAHFAGAESEIVVESGHSVLSNPIAIEEVRRVLLLHAEQTRCTRTRKREIEFPEGVTPPAQAGAVSPEDHVAPAEAGGS